MTTTDSLDDYIDGAARALRLPIEADWRPSVIANLTTLFAFAHLVDTFELPDEMPPAHIYRA